MHKHQNPEVFSGNSPKLRLCLMPCPKLRHVVYLLPVCMCSVVCDSLQPHERSPPGFSVHGVLQARILEWVAMPSSRGSSPPWNQTRVSWISCVGRQILHHQRHLGSPLHCTNTPSATPTFNGCSTKILPCTGVPGLLFVQDKIQNPVLSKEVPHTLSLQLVFLVWAAYDCHP